MNSRPTPEQSAENANFCASLVRDRDFPRYAATLFAPQNTRRALLALFAFNAEVAHVRDHVTQPLPGEIRLQWWSDLIDGHDHGDVAGNPVAAELMLAIAAHDLPREVLHQLIEAHIFDVYDDPMPTQDALKTYCLDTSSALFALSARILGAEGNECEHVSRYAGLAQGLSDVVASLPLHAARHQLYLPHDLLDKNGVAEADIFAGRMTPALGDVVQSLRAEAILNADMTEDLLANVPEDVLPAFLPLALMRRALSRPSMNVFQPERLSRLSILWTLWRAARLKPFRT